MLVGGQIKDGTNARNPDEVTNILGDEDEEVGSDEDEEVDLVEEEPAFLRGKTKQTMQMSPVKIVKVSEDERPVSERDSL